MKTQIYFIIGILLLVTLITNVNAYQKLCLSYGQSVPSTEIVRFTCFSDLCQLCTNDNFYPVHPGNCNDVLECRELNQSVNLSAPVLTINQPINKLFYNSRKVNVNIKTDQPSSLYLKDNNKKNAQWVRISSETRNYNKTMGFKEGLNNITFRATNRYGKTSNITKYFYIDTKKPRVTKFDIDQNKFLIEFNEDNPLIVYLKYQNGSDIKTSVINLNNCIVTSSKYSCMINYSRNDYENKFKKFDGSKLNFWFEINDKAGNSEISRVETVYIDMTNPVLNSINYTINVRNVNIIMNISESDFMEASYLDKSDIKQKVTKICSGLKNGICEKKFNFSPGNHDLDITIKDKTGNIATTNIKFQI